MKLWKCDNHKKEGQGTEKQTSVCINCLVQEWGLEGYHLWAVTIDTDPSNPGSTPQVNGDAGSSSSGHSDASSGTCRCEMLQFQFLKSALTVNPCMVSLVAGSASQGEGMGMKASLSILLVVLLAGLVPYSRVTVQSVITVDSPIFQTTESFFLFSSFFF